MRTPKSDKKYGQIIKCPKCKIEMDYFGVKQVGDIITCTHRICKHRFRIDKKTQIGTIELKRKIYGI